MKMPGNQTSTLGATRPWLLACLLLGAACALRSQAVSTATVTGRVVDEADAVVSGAAIKIIGVENGTVRDVVTNADGL
ncbi:MAG TPA: carboxypeptidase-like regulatory domain-containing protein, partial [Chthoniobacterales bacterium]|nr:carboxypeptidase-like regulatory domain-containing protein [Chthoniobacterales bacterium]